MPAKTGGSHATASFLTLVVGTLLSKYLWSVAPPLGEAAIVALTVLRTTAGVPVPVTDQFAGAVVVMTGLSFVWGVIYHFARN